LRGLLILRLGLLGIGRLLLLLGSTSAVRACSSCVLTGTTRSVGLAVSAEFVHAVDDGLLVVEVLV
jgi:hypothetical protein